MTTKKENAAKAELNDAELEFISGGMEEPELLCPDIGGSEMPGNQQMTINRICRSCRSVIWFTERQEHYYCDKCGNLIC